jgi:hypothetical protein
MSGSATTKVVGDVVIWWHGDANDPMEINFLDPTYPSDHDIAKMPSWLVKIYTGLSERLTPMDKQVSESATRDRLATPTFPGLIGQYLQLLKQQHAIYKPAQDNNHSLR